MSSKKRSSRKSKRTSVPSEASEAKRRYRPCPKASCGEQEPRCCLQSSDNCCRDGYTSRWYHVSLGEHFCNECFENYYRVHKPGYQTYKSWSNQRSKETMKRFVADEVMPFWLQCTIPECGKWREVRQQSLPEPDFVNSFQCSVVYGSSQTDSCHIEEEACVAMVFQPHWLSMAERPLLKQSPAAPFLKQFVDEEIGFCPTKSHPDVEAPKWIEPFLESLNGASSIWPSPESMTDDERSFMPHMTTVQPIYLALRNSIVAFWNLHPKEFLTAERLNPYILCRGLVRIYCLQQATKIIEYLTRKGVINYGFVASPSKILNCPQEVVIVVGSGISGLSSARQLQNLGIKTIVLEADSRIGGRLQTIHATTIHGLVNNPLTILCHQQNLDIVELPPNPVFITEDGTMVDDEVTERMLINLSGMMQGHLQSSKQEKVDSDWPSVLVKHRKDLHDMDKGFSEEEDQLFDLLLKISDIEQLTNSKDLTSKNFQFPLRAGKDGLVAEGLFSLIKLADGLEVKLKTVVQSIRLTGSGVELATSQGPFEATRAIVTVPVPILRDDIQFQPLLPLSKMNALKELGNVMHERVIVQFLKKFWKSVTSDKSLKFGFLSKKTEAFQYFVDVSEVVPDKTPTLVAFVTNDNSKLFEDKSDAEIVDLCLETLKKHFKRLEIKVPDPTSTTITRWSEQPHIRSCGNYIKVGSSYQLYDDMAESVNDRIFFAGDMTFRKIPNSATGAFLSGLREATHVLDVVSPVASSDLASNNQRNGH